MHKALAAQVWRDSKYWYVSFVIGATELESTRTETFCLYIEQSNPEQDAKDVVTWLSGITKFI